MLVLTRASMWPRLVSRGRNRPGGEPRGREHELQCGRGWLAAEGWSLLSTPSLFHDWLQCGRGWLAAEGIWIDGQGLSAKTSFNVAAVG